MKRYRILQIEFNFIANSLRMEINEEWTEEEKVHYRENRQRFEDHLSGQYGSHYLDQKIQNILDIEAQAPSVIMFQNVFYRETRDAFIVGAYYPALTAASSLGELILNELIRAIRNLYPVSKKLPKFKAASSITNWDKMIDALEEWNALLPDVISAFRELHKIRNRIIHFDRVKPDEIRDLAVRAIRLMNLIIGRQFGPLGLQPWFIPGIRGASYIRKDWERDPFVRTFLLPHSLLVGPDHRLSLDRETGIWSLQDEGPYEDREISDQEFQQLVDPDGPRIVAEETLEENRGDTKV